MSEQLLAEMTLYEAINTVCMYLHRQQVVFTLYRAWEIAESHAFKVSVHEVQPEDCYRIFEVSPDAVSDCWNVVEVEAQA